MAKNDASKVFNGTHGTLWVDNEIWAEVDGFEAIVSPTYEDVSFANDLAPYRKQTGWTSSGSITIKKVNSRVSMMMADGVKSGRTPRPKFVGKLDDPEVNGAERIALYDVTLDSFQLMKYEQKTLGSQDISFQFSDYDLIDTVDAE